ncbi:hypothetical protein [[Ruminococcus] torques]|uniref:hypothetical protein n=1 Tax=[Ruminococcus] torques TaxID=33039 RepID=UPI0026DD15DD|nr:hypothetical protein [[Ruminococcus] torques]
MVRLETGDTGIAVTAESDGTLYSSIFGIENYVVSTGNMFKAEIQSNNKIKVSDGSAIMNGRHIRIPSGDSELVTIDNGSQGMNRIDLIVLRYKKNSAGVESGELVVIKGMETSDVAKTPDFTHGDILTGAAQADFPLYEVELNGINIINLRSLFETVGNITGLEKQMSTINKYLSELRDKHKSQNKFAASEIDTGETWIDGKKIYRRTYITTDPVSPSNTLTIPISLTGIADTLWIDQQNSFIRSKGGEQVYPLPLPRYSGSNNYVGVWINTAGIRLFSDSSWNQNWEKCITIKYTKK